MLRLRSPRPIRTTLDLADAKQVKSIRRRLGVSDADLVRIVDKIGNSLAGIQKEVELERQRPLSAQPQRKHLRHWCRSLQLSLLSNTPTPMGRGGQHGGTR